MDMLPQLAVGTVPATRALNRPFAEEPKEQQIELLYQQMLQQQQLIAVQVMRIDSLTTIQESVAAQNARLQELAVATNQLAEEDTAATKEALAASKQENLVKEAEIAMLKALLASQKETYTASQEAARQALATQTQALKTAKEKTAILEKAFETTEQILHRSEMHSSNQIHPWQSARGYQHSHFRIPTPDYIALATQMVETRAQLQQNIQNQATAAQNLGDQ